MESIRVSPAILATATICAAAFAMLASLWWVYQWAVTNTDAADFELQRLVVSTMLVCTMIAAPVVFVRVIDGQHRIAALGVITVAASAAFVTVAASAGSTLLIAMAIAPATDPGEFGRPLFRVAYAGALALSLAAGIFLAWSGAQHRRARVASAALAVVVIAVGWAYLAVGSSEVNQCVAASEFPLARDRAHVCSGY